MTLGAPQNTQAAPGRELPHRCPPPIACDQEPAVLGDGRGLHARGPGSLKLDVTNKGEVTGRQIPNQSLDCPKDQKAIVLGEELQATGALWAPHEVGAAGADQVPCRRIPNLQPRTTPCRHEIAFCRHRTETRTPRHRRADSELDDQVAGRCVPNLRAKRRPVGDEPLAIGEHLHAHLLRCPKSWLERRRNDLQAETTRDRIPNEHPTIVSACGHRAAARKDCNICDRYVVATEVEERQAR
mmetsp:Transcript_78056/g.226483  ORF Transcript_78056/g.226483 Transcript_78056/m.226483 type:complete len:241 (+) Transcript_78056:185-907(+)